MKQTNCWRSSFSILILLSTWLASFNTVSGDDDAEQSSFFSLRGSSPAVALPDLEQVNNGNNGNTLSTVWKSSNDFEDSEILSDINYGTALAVDFDERSEIGIAHRNRRLQELTYFEPLSCNAVPCALGNVLFSDLDYDLTKTVVIPCGWCVTMDYVERDTLSLEKGLDIQGHLKFPNGYKIIVETPFVFVQGRLDLLAVTRPVTGTPHIRFLMTGHQSYMFFPHHENAHVCPQGCLVGTKPFVVAGGRVNFRGLPGECKTWTRLYDTAGSSSLPSNPVDEAQVLSDAKNGDCNIDGIYMKDSFDSMSTEWTGGWGGKYEVTSSGTFLVSERKSSTDHGPTWDMREVRQCLKPGHPYLFSARVKLSGPKDGMETLCKSHGGPGCLVLFSMIKRGNNGMYGRQKGFERQEFGWVYGEWFDFHAIVTYDMNETADDNIYQLLQLRGPDPEVSIEMDNVTFAEPPADVSVYETNICSGNLVLNGNAEYSSEHPFPFDAEGGFITVEEEEGNQFFRQHGRTRDDHSIIYEMTSPTCLMSGAQYSVSVRMRVGTEELVKSRMEVRSFFSDNTSHQKTLVHCPKSSNNLWVTCDGTVTISNEIIPEGATSIRVEFETIDAPFATVDIDNVLIELIAEPQTAIFVPSSGIDSCYGDGAEILLTSHTLDFKGQVRRLIGQPQSLQNGMVRLELNESIVPPTTTLQDPNFAVEVAFLNRNILFDVLNGGSSLIGGHFMVMQTPHVPQMVEGVEFKHFGQQGILGRYPIHFHLCDNVHGSHVSKNSVRQSFQRCVVIHGSHNLTVVNNVAYDTVGHCYMLEDGGETDNLIVNNLGAETHAASLLVGNDESDNVPSTFWCTHPYNTWIGNVAAGSSHSGFWFELRLSVRGPTLAMPLSKGMNPRFSNLKVFKNNVAHSNGLHGMRVYPHGFFPSNEAVFLNCKSYKNWADGWFLHNSRNLAIEGGVYADNRVQVDIDFADIIRVEGASMIGMTPDYKEILATQSFAPWHFDTIIGIELHGFARESGNRGARIRHLEFSSFNETGTNQVSLFHVDPQSRSTHFNYWTTFGAISITDTGVTPLEFDFKDAMSSFKDLFFTDIDSSLRPSGMIASGSSTVMSINALMLSLMDTSDCATFASRGYMYCPNTCLGTFSFAVDPAGTEDYVLRVTGSGGSADVMGSYELELDANRNTLLRKSRVFAVSAPKGLHRYTASFLNADGEVVWPTYVEESLVAPQCPDGLEVGDVRIVSPSVPMGQCSQLIRNGDLELSVDEQPHFWLHQDCGLEVLLNGGLDGSIGLSDRFQTFRHGAIGQNLDTRCLVKGLQYEVRAWVKLVQDGLIISCEEHLNCPKARVRVRTQADLAGSHFSEMVWDVATEFAMPFGESGWNLLNGILNVNDRLANAASVSFFIERGLTDTRMVVDNVTLSLIPSVCTELVFNGNFHNGKLFWEGRSNRHKSIKLDTIADSDGNMALEASRRTDLSDSPMQNIRLGCLEEGKRYKATSLIKVQNDDGSLYDCEINTHAGPSACPRMTLRAVVGVGKEMSVKKHDMGSIAVTDHGMTHDGWRTMSGLFIATHYDEIAEELLLSWEATPGKRIIVDDVSITSIDESCNKDLIVNGKAEDAMTPRFWRTWKNRGNATLSIVESSGGNAFRVSDRAGTGDGIHQFLNPKCFVAGTKFKLKAKMKLFSRSGQVNTSCDPNEEGNINDFCPPITIAGWKTGNFIVDERRHMTNRLDWDPNHMNQYEVEFEVWEELADCDRVAIAFRTYNLDWDLTIDDVSINRVYV